MSDGFLDFSIGENDDNVGKRTTRFKAEDGRSYRVSFAWLSVHTDGGWDDTIAFDSDGNIHPEAQVRFTGCERIYKPGVGYILYKGPAYAQFGQPKQSVGTILVVWPTDKEGDLDVASFKNGKGWQVQPWIFSPTKYGDIKKSHKRFPLTNHDMVFTCPVGGGQYQKLTFTPESDSLLQKLGSSEKPEFKAVMKKIVADIRAAAASIHRDLARDLTIDQIREALGEEVEDATGGAGNHASKDVDELLDNVL